MPLLWGWSGMVLANDWGVVATGQCPKCGQDVQFTVKEMVKYRSARLLGSWSSGDKAWDVACARCGHEARFPTREDAMSYLRGLPHALKGPLTRHELVHMVGTAWNEYATTVAPSALFRGPSLESFLCDWLGFTGSIIRSRSPLAEYIISHPDEAQWALDVVHAEIESHFG